MYILVLAIEGKRKLRIKYFWQKYVKVWNSKKMLADI